jgi:hypothetical protein
MAIQAGFSDQFRPLAQVERAQAAIKNIATNHAATATSRPAPEQLPYRMTFK